MAKVDDPFIRAEMKRLLDDAPDDIAKEIDQVIKETDSVVRDPGEGSVHRSLDEQLEFEAAYNAPERQARELKAFDESFKDLDEIVHDPVTGEKTTVGKVRESMESDSKIAEAMSFCNTGGKA